MEEKGKQDSTANMMNVNENCMDIEIICRQEENVGDQLPYADEELITHFLDKKMIDQRFLDHTVHDVDFFLYHPQQLSRIALSLSLSLSVCWGFVGGGAGWLFSDQYLSYPECLSYERFLFYLICEFCGIKHDLLSCFCFN